MELHLIRHTSVDVPKGYCYGHMDVSLATTFEDEAQHTLSQITTVDTKTIYSSPSQRCVKLAQKINPIFKTDDRLMELNFGDWEGLLWDDLNEGYALEWMNDYVNLACPNGESFQELVHRFEQFILEIKKHNKDLIIVTHSGIIRAAFHYFDRIPFDKLFDVEVAFGSVHAFKL